MVWNLKPFDFKFSTLYQTNIWSEKVYFIAATYFSKFGYQNSITYEAIAFLINLNILIVKDLETP